MLPAGLQRQAELSVLSSRIKRIRDKYEVELQELERSERKLQERCNELKGRLAELEGESIRLQGLLKHREQEVEEIRKVSGEHNRGLLLRRPGVIPGLQHPGVTPLAPRRCGTSWPRSGAAWRT